MTVASAKSFLDQAFGKPVQAAQALVTEAHVHATLALVEQQRVANLMAYLVLLDEGIGSEDSRQIRAALGLDQ